jgi:hypothetical protein
MANTKFKFNRLQVLYASVLLLAILTSVLVYIRYDRLREAVFIHGGDAYFAQSLEDVHSSLQPLFELAAQPFFSKSESQAANICSLMEPENPEAQAAFLKCIESLNLGARVERYYNAVLLPRQVGLFICAYGKELAIRTYGAAEVARAISIPDGTRIYFQGKYVICDSNKKAPPEETAPTNRPKRTTK